MKAMRGAATWIDPHSSIGDLHVGTLL